jgi:hypothetical protein
MRASCVHHHEVHPIALRDEDIMDVGEVAVWAGSNKHNDNTPAALSES